MDKRFGDIAQLAEEDRDFVRRRTMNSTVAKFIIVMVIGFFILIAAAFNLEELGTPTVIAIIVCILFLVAAFTSLFVGKVEESVFSNEFENALFAGAAGAGAEFFFIIQKNTQIVYASPTAHQFFTFKKKEDAFVGFDTLLTTSGLSKNAREELIRGFERGERSKVLFEYTDHKNTHRSLYLILELIKRPKGFFVLKAVRTEYDFEAEMPDITLHGNEHALGEVLKELPWGVFVAKADGTIEYSNQPLTDLLGYGRHEIAEKHVVFRDLVFGREELEGHFRDNWQGELALRHKMGQPVKVHMKQLVLTDEKGAPKRYGFVSKAERIYVDEDEGKEAGSVHKMLLQLIENSPIAIITLNEDGAVTEYNAAFSVMAGVQPMAEGKTPNLFELIDEESKNHVATLLESIKAGKTGERKPVDIAFKGAVKNTASLFINPVNEGAGSAYIAYLIDTTEQKNLELRFVHSQKMQAVGQLAGGIAHDFNNLLTAMIGFCDLLLIRHPAGDQSFADIMQIKQNANRAANLVRQLLAFSRKQTLQPAVLDITEILAELSNLIRRLIGENIELQMEHGRGLGMIKVDQTQLEQVIINLAVNARDAMPSGGALKIRTSNVHIDKGMKLSDDLVAPSQDEPIAEGDYVMVEMIDTGVGIPRDVIQSIFDPFFTTKEVGSGTGLGLSTVYGIISQTGGHIYVNSKENKGTRFSIFFQHSTDADMAAMEGRTAQEKLPSQDLTGAGTVLLVEDEAPVRIFSARALRNKGYSVLEADSGEAAMALVEEKGDQIDVIITDVVMPGMTGPAMIEKITAKYPDTKVIFISGYAEDAFMKSYGAERKFHFLPKPFTLKTLAGKVKEVLEGEGDDTAGVKEEA